MNKLYLKKSFNIFSSVILLTVSSINVLAERESESSVESASLSSSEKKIKHIHGISVTGVNSVLGDPLFSWGEPFGASFNFPTMGVYDELADHPQPITADTPYSAVLASYIDPLFISLFNKPDDFEVDPSLLNVPLREIPVNADFFLSQRLPLPSIRDADPLELSQASPAKDITLGRWLKARGTASIRCLDDNAYVKLRMRSLIPNRMYSVWATMGLPPQPGATTPAAFPIPVGGTPNYFMTDERGNAVFKRWLNFCPLDIETSGSPLLFIDVQYNAIHQSWGSIVAPGFIDGNWPGTITFSQMVFPVNVELLED